VWIRIERQLSLTNALDTIENELNNLNDIAGFINISTLMSWERLIKAAFELFISSDINISCKLQYEQVATTEAKLLLFLEILMEYKYTNSAKCIRGSDGFTFDFYLQSGGAAQLAFFLFGRASQQRK